MKAHNSLAMSYEEQAEFGLPMTGRFDDLPENKKVWPCQVSFGKQTQLVSFCLNTDSDIVKRIHLDESTRNRF